MTMTKFERRDVLGAGIEIPGAAGGLREPLKLDPVEMHIEETCIVILKLSVAKVRFDPIKDTDGGLTRVHVMNVVEAAFADEGAVKDILEETRHRIAEAKGTPELPLDEAASTKPRQTHEQAKAVTEDSDPLASPSPASLQPIGVA